MSAAGADGENKRGRLGSAVGIDSSSKRARSQPSGSKVDIVTVPGEWSTAMERARQDGKLLDVTLVISSGRRLRAHKLVLLTHSPYLDGLLTSGFAESAAGFDELTVQGDSGAIEAIVDCMYTGKLVLSPETVQAIIRVANMLGVGTAEQAACQYFVGQLSTHTVIDALGFAAQLVESGAHGRWLYQQCLSYSRTHFEDCRGSFQRLSCETLCELIRSDDLRVRSEESVLETVRSWVLDDLHSRQSSLPQLAVLIRFPRLPTAAQLSLANEPVIQHLLAAQSALVPQLLTECLPAFAKTPAADDCPRLQARLPLQSSWRATWSSAMKDKSITLSADLLGALNNVPLDEDDEDFDGSGEMVWSDRPLPNHGVVYWELAFTGENLSDGDELGSGYVVGVSNAEYFAANPNPNLFATGKGVWGWTDDRGCVEDGVVDDDIVTERPYHCYRANDRVGVLADMGAKRLQFYKNGQKMEGVVVRGFPEDVRIVTTPYNRGVTATLSFPLGPAQD